jgi:preprotein translocase subunit SecD
MKRALPLVLMVLVSLGALAATFAVGNSPELGLDLQGGASVVLSPPEGVDTSTLDQAIEVIRNRVDALGVAEPDITRQGNAVIVELPGVNDQQQAIELVGQTAELRFRPVLAALPPGDQEPTTDTTVPGATTTTAPGATTTTVAGATTTTPPADTTTTTPGETTTTTAAGSTTTTTAPAVALTPRDQNDPEATVILAQLDDSGNEVARYQLGPAALRGSAISGADAEFNNVEWTTKVTFNADGSKAFDAVAAECFNRQPTCPTGALGIELDGVVISAPAIQESSFGGTAVISGGFDQAEAQNLELVLRYGALPVQLEQETVQTVSPSLGQDSLRAGLVAGAIGTAMVLLYLVFYYRALGLVVVGGMIIWSALQWSVISYLGATQGLALSLAGVTGIIVSVGVTVDSYIVYFERLKDEIRSGRTIRSSVDRGFKRAFRTILIADTSALLGAVTLYLLTVGPVRGFAFFLGLSTVLDIVVSYFFTRPVVALLARQGVFSSGRFLGVTKQAGRVDTSLAAGAVT